MNTPHAMQCRKTSTQVHDVCEAIIFSLCHDPKIFAKRTKMVSRIDQPWKIQNRQWTNTEGPLFDGFKPIKVVAVAPE